MENQVMDNELSALLERTAEAVRDLGWNVVVLVLRDQVSQTTYPVAAATADPALKPELLAIQPVPFRPASWRQERFRISRSYFVDHRVHDGVHALGEGVHRLDLGAREDDEWQSDDFLIIPLEIDGEELGWLTVDDPQDRQRPTPAKIRALEIFADQAALTIQQARLYLHAREIVARQGVLNEIAFTISQHLEMIDLFPSIIRQLQHVFTFERASITLREGDNPHTQIFTHDTRSEIEPQTPTALEDIAFAQIVQANQPYRIVDELSGAAELDDEVRLIEDGIRSYACLPLTVWNHVIGVLSLAAETPHVFRLADAEFLLQIAQHIAGAVWNALLHELEQKRRHAADALAQLSEIINSTLELDEVLERALQQLARVVDYDTASILLVEGDNLKIVACRGFEDPQALVGAVFRVEEDNISHRTMRAKRVRVVADVQQLPEWGHNRDDVEGFERIRGWIGAPLLVRDQSIGLLVIDKLEPDFYTDEDGETVAAFATQIAIAIENARLYQATQQQLDKLAAILTDTTDAIIVLDETRRIWLLNPAARRTLKLPRDKRFIGQPLQSVELPELCAALETAQANQQPMTSEITGPDDLSLNASFAPVRGVGWVIVMQDITPFKELDRLRTEWVAAVSHDLKNPIQVIQLGAALLEIDGPLNELQLERIKIIQRGTEQLSDLVADVLDLARLEAGPSLRLAPADPVGIITASLAEVEHLVIKKQQQLSSYIAPDIPIIQSDSKLLQRALVNLLSNAIKYTPRGGTIALRAGLIGSELSIEVVDNGLGIPAEALPHLFERFYRVPGSDAEGTGLGLSIVKSIVEKHNGTIRVNSAEDRGSTFAIALPV
jgi:signal transduction histidine kinase